MRKIIFWATAGQYGTDTYEAFLFPDGVTDEHLNEQAWLFAIQHAEMYGIYPISYFQDEDLYEEGNIPEDMEDNYSDNIEGAWEDFDPEKHDGRRAGGGSFTELYDSGEIQCE